MEIKKLEEEILQLEELLYVLDGELERLYVDISYTTGLKSALLENICILKTPGIVVVLESYKKTKIDLKHLDAKVKHNSKLENDLVNKIASIEKELVAKEKKKNSLTISLSQDKILEFKRNLW